MNSGTQPVSILTWLGFCAMALGMFMAVLDIQIVATALPEIQVALGIARDQMSWVQTAYLIAEVIAIPLTGFLTRALTMRGLFVAAIALFTAASIGCAMSVGFASLIGFRVVQGFAGGVLIPLVFSAVFLLFPFRTQGIATTIAGMLAVLAPTLGPLAGGWITESFSWHWLFLINVIPGIVSLIIAWTFLPREAPVFSVLRGGDGIALAAMALSLACLEIALKEAPNRGWLGVLPLGLFLLCLLAGVLFAYRALTRQQPIVELRTFADRRFACAAAMSFLLGMGLYGSVYLIPVFLAFVQGLGALAIGWIMLATGAAQLLAAPVAVALERRADARLLSILGFSLFAAGLALSAFATHETSGHDMFWPQVVRGAAIMFCLLPPTRIALGHLAPESIADASALFNLMRNLGGAIGIALIDTIIYGRGPAIAEKLTSRLMSGDRDTGHLIGASDSLLMQAMSDPVARETIRTLIERQSLVTATNEAWAMLAIATVIAAIVAPFARARRAVVSVA